MAFSSCLCHPLTPLKIVCFRSTSPLHDITVDRRSTASLLVTSTRQFSREGGKRSHEWSLVSGFEVTVKPKLAGSSVYRKGSRVNVSCLASLQIVSNVFTMGTVVVLPFYALMVVAPQARLTRKFMDSGIPYVVLGLLYAYLLYHSWTPDTIRYMFSSKYMLPELSGIAKMFSSETTLASAWIHLLTIDLFAARQVFWDGLENEVETRHSVSLCLLFCPLGVMAHVFTKALTQFARSDKHNM